MPNENFGPAEKIIQTVLSFTDHAVHNRPGYIVPDRNSVVGVKWAPVTTREQEGNRVIFRLDKVGKKTVEARVGNLEPDGTTIRDDHNIMGQYRPAGLYPEVVTWMYKQVAEVWRLNNEFAARWASYAFDQEHKDLKVILAAFMLVQSRKGDPVLDKGIAAFYDDDFRDVGEAMMLLQKKDRDLNVKLLLRIRDVLALPGVVQINRELGFGQSTLRPYFGRWRDGVINWLNYRAQNSSLLDGLVKAGFKSGVKRLCCKTNYKPENPKFFETLHWKQKQSEDGRRTIAIGKELVPAETWAGLSEKEICERIVKEKPNFKRVVGLLPKGQGLTRAIVAAAIENSAMSSKDLIIYTPTLEELGLLQVPDIQKKWQAAVAAVEDTRAVNIALRVRSTKTQKVLQTAADVAVKKAAEEVSKNIRIYVLVDISGSMEVAIDAAKKYLAQMLPGINPERLHIATFNTSGTIIELKHSSTAGVKQAFKGIKASGGTDHASGVRKLAQFPTRPDEDALFIFVGDEQDPNTFEVAVRSSKLNPLAFGLIRVLGSMGNTQKCVQDTAARLSIPCFMIDEKTFADPYQVPRTLRNLIAATPVSKAREYTPLQRETLVDIILNTKLLQKPAWAVKEKTDGVAGPA